KQGTGIAGAHALAPLPEPKLPAIAKTHDIIVTGVGGTGVVTIGGILGMAAYLEGKGVGILDMAGLAQKGGAVYSHIRIAERSEDIHAIRIAAGGADLVLGGDIVVAGNKKVLAAVKHGTTEMVINLAEVLPGDFTRNADFSLPTERLKRAILADAGAEKTHFIDATRAATALLGNSIGSNIFLVGYAYQLGAIPLSAASIMQGIELSGEHLRLYVHLAPPLLARADKLTGEPKKMTFGPWIFPLFRLLAKFKFLRGTAFDPFGYTLERRRERALVREYEMMLEEVLARLSGANHHIAVALAAIPEKIRGFGHVKVRHLKAAKADEAALLDQLRAGVAPLLKAAE